MAISIGEQIDLKKLEKPKRGGGSPRKSEWDELGLMDMLTSMEEGKGQLIKFESKEQRGKKYGGLRSFLSSRSDENVGWFSLNNHGETHILIKKKSEPPKPRGKRQ